MREWKEWGDAPMRGKIYIHIGLHKTGTTSIQHTLFEQRPLLLERGVNYLGLSSNHSRIFEIVLPDEVRTAQARERLVYTSKAEIKEKLLDELSRNRSGKIVISGEGLSVLPRAAVVKLKELLDPYAESYRVIVYVREPYDYANSAILQQLKGGYIFQSGYGLSVPRQHFKERIEKFFEVFGKESCDIRVFGRKRLHQVGGLIADFIAAIEESPGVASSLQEMRANEAMCHEAALILSKLNSELPPFTPDRRLSPARCPRIHTWLAKVKGEKYVIPPEDFMAVQRQILGDLKWLEQHYGGQVFEPPNLLPASQPSWGVATVASLQALVQEIRSGIEQEAKRAGADAERHPLQTPPELAWLDGVARAPAFDERAIASVTMFINALALQLHRLRSARRRRRGADFATSEIASLLAAESR